jgi:Spy/CpxP family protein refolding chaperone
MHAAQLLSQALDLSRQAGYQIREEILDGAGGGHCLIRGQKWLLLDLTQTHQEQLQDVLDALRSEPQLDLSQAPAPLVESLHVARAA